MTPGLIYKFIKPAAEAILSVPLILQVMNICMKKYRFVSLWAVILGLFGLVGCHKPEAPEYQGFENIRLSRTTARETQVSASLKFFNPNHFSLDLKRAEVNIYLNDKPAGHSSLDSTIFIPKTDTFSVPVSLTIDMQSIFSNALQILMDKEVKIKMEGKAWLKRGGVPFSVPFQYEGTQPLSSFMQ